MCTFNLLSLNSKHPSSLYSALSRSEWEPTKLISSLPVLLLFVSSNRTRGRLDRLEARGIFHCCSRHCCVINSSFLLYRKVNFSLCFICIYSIIDILCFLIYMLLYITLYLYISNSLVDITFQPQRYWHGHQASYLAQFSVPGPSVTKYLSPRVSLRSMGPIQNM